MREIARHNVRTLDLFLLLCALCVSVVSSCLWLAKEPLMPPLLQVALSNAVMASLLALLAAAVTYFVRRPALAHGLWLLVLLKLLTPPIIPLQVSWPAPENLVPNNDFQASTEPEVMV